MPRGKVIKRSLDEQITILEEDIRIAQNKLNKLQTKWKELQKQKKEEDMAELYALLKQTGMSVDQVRQALTAAPQPAFSNSTDDTEVADGSIIDIA